MNKKIFTILVLALGLAACDSPSSNAGRALETFSGAALQRAHDSEQVALGESVYRQYCARCHGRHGEGDPNWRSRDADGMFPPPPLNGTGHAWHHPRQWLKQMILNGSDPGRGKMPAWRGKLSEAEIEAVIEWFQSRWPDPVYAAWYENQQRNRGLR